ncbi:hypothetical protein PV326_000708, partial [Microctonus aethiopoides]
SEYSFHGSSCGSINSITYDGDDGDDGDNRENMNFNHDHQPGSSHEFGFIPSPEYELTNENIHNNGDFNKEDSNNDLRSSDVILPNERFQQTPGLIELLFTKSPNDSIISYKDKENYMNIIKSTNALYKHYNPDGSLMMDK